MTVPKEALVFRRLAALIVLSALTIVGGCSARYIQEDRQAALNDLFQTYVGSAKTPPSTNELSSYFGDPVVYRIEDLTLHAYTLDSKQLKALHAETKKAAKRAKKEIEKERKAAGQNHEGSSLGAKAYVLMTVLSPIVVPALLISLPIAAADYAVGSAIVAAGNDDRVERTAGRKALFAYDHEGVYRWHACCVPPDAKGAESQTLSALPDATAPYVVVEELPEVYRVDNLVVRCHRAKSGERWAQKRFLIDFKKVESAPGHTYYWARVLEENGGSDASRTIERLKTAMSNESISVEEKAYVETPLNAIDCRAIAEQLIGAMNPGSG